MIYALVGLSMAYLGQTLVLAHIVRENGRERAQMRREGSEERTMLLQRIQAPEVAVAQAIPDGPEGLLHVPLDDFDAYEKDLKEQLNGV